MEWWTVGTQASEDLISMHDDPNQPFDTVFGTFGKFWYLCILKDQPKSDGQLINIA